MNISKRKTVNSAISLVAVGILGCINSVAFAQDAMPIPSNSIWLGSLDLSLMKTGWGMPTADHTISGGPIRIDGKTYAHGVGTHASSEFDIDLHGAATEFSSIAGVDDDTGGKGSVQFVLLVDGNPRYESPVVHGNDPAVPITISLVGAQRLTLRVTDGGDGITFDHADWANAVITLASVGSPVPAALPVPNIDPRMTIPPIDPLPAIHGAMVIGATPGKPFLFKIAATGTGPLTYSATNLPKGLTIDRSSGIISGAIFSAGGRTAIVTVAGHDGKATRKLYIVCGEHKLALTPPMGWNSWDAYSGGVTEENTKASAGALVTSGLIDHGYQYVNIDDTWEAGRDAQGNIQTNNKFSDMAGLISYIHGLGMKFGIYSSPGPKTCGGYEASYGHEAQDAATYATWGVDYLKYDYCSYATIAQGDTSLPTVEKPYVLMSNCLNSTDRDIVFSYCEYGMDDPWKWGPAAGGNLWRVNNDLEDEWYIQPSNTGWYPGSLKVLIDQMADIDQYVTPGHWNDPDMLSVGIFDWGSPHPTQLTGNQQILQFSMWAMSSAPLLIGGDVTKLDPFTVALLSNDEVIDVDQDQLGKGAERVFVDGTSSVWVKPLFDGSKAVALVNEDPFPAIISAKWSDLGLSQPTFGRDLWLHKNLGKLNGEYTVEVPPCGCVMLKLGVPKS